MRDTLAWQVRISDNTKLQVEARQTTALGRPLGPDFVRGVSSAALRVAPLTDRLGHQLRQQFVLVPPNEGFVGVCRCMHDCRSGRALLAASSRAALETSALSLSVSRSSRPH